MENTWLAETKKKLAHFSINHGVAAKSVGGQQAFLLHRLGYMLLEWETWGRKKCVGRQLLCRLRS
jgi:hypothetical protein